MKNFALIGIAGYVAERHLRAIRDTGNDLLAAMDRNDSVGILDHYFPAAHFFTELERFDRHLDKLKGDKVPIDYLSVCTPNYLHDAHVRLGLRSGADVICEKPLVLNPWNAENLLKAEEATGKKVFNILQLRYHPQIQELKNKMQEENGGSREIELTYITPRGAWYHNSWKGDISKSGGIATNIGIHFFDMLLWIFGRVKDMEVHLSDQQRAAGYLQFDQAIVKWFLSIDEADLPRNNGQHKRQLRAITVDDQQIEFSGGFDHLHTASYQAILSGKGFGIEEALPSIELAHAIRNARPVIPVAGYHSFCKLKADQ